MALLLLDRQLKHCITHAEGPEDTRRKLTEAPDGIARLVAPDPASPDRRNPMTPQSYAVLGMTCGHCAGAVTSELKSINGVTDVRVELVAGGISTVTVVSDTRLNDTQVTGALEEAGDYRLAQP